MAEEFLLRKLQKLSDLELALLICLVTNEHCLIKTTPTSYNDVTRELGLIVTKIFRLRYVTIECSKSTTLDEFANLILFIETNTTRSDTPTRIRYDKFLSNTAKIQSSSRSSANKTQIKPTSIYNVIIAKNFNYTSKEVQNQALELIRTGRLLSGASAYNVPKHFLFITVLVLRDGPGLTKHLNDYIFISHFHHQHNKTEDVEDNLNDDSSLSSVVKLSSPRNDSSKIILTPFISSEEIDELSDLCKSVKLSMEVKQYQMDIISFLRLHRAVAGGITALATKKFDKLAKCLATLHNLEFVTPSLIALAARKVYLHRIQIIKPEKERSMQWGSDIEAVAALLKGITSEDILEEILGDSGVEPPL